MAGSRSPGWPVLLVLLVLGGIIGGWIGQALTKVWPSLAALGSTQSLGIPNFTADLGVFTISFGFNGFLTWVLLICLYDIFS